MSTEIEHLRELIDERHAAQEKALTLQAEEYARRLEVLNGEHARIAEIQSRSVTQERFDLYIRSEAEKTEITKERFNERLGDYVRRFEQRQRELDTLLSAQEGAATQVKDAAIESARRANRNLGVASLGLGIVVLLANHITPW